MQGQCISPPPPRSISSFVVAVAGEEPPAVPASTSSLPRASCACARFEQRRLSSSFEKPPDVLCLWRLRWSRLVALASLHCWPRRANGPRTTTPAIARPDRRQQRSACNRTNRTCSDVRWAARAISVGEAVSEVYGASPSLLPATLPTSPNVIATSTGTQQQWLCS